MTSGTPVNASAVRYALSPDEYQLLRSYLSRRVARPERTGSKSAELREPTEIQDDYHAAAFRSSLRVFIGTLTGLKSWELVSSFLSSNRRTTTQKSRANRSILGSTHLRLALSLSSILYLHRLLRRFFLRLRLGLLKEQTRVLSTRHPRLFRGLTSRITPAIGASLAGFALALYPGDQLRITIAIYVAARALEMLYNASDRAGYLRKKPSWVGSWLLSPLAQGQLLHAFVFDRDCFPKIYGDFIIKYTPYYIQRRPANIAASLRWPGTDQIVDSLGEMARLKWPLFISPILRPTVPTPLPPTIDSSISLITSRAHPSIQHLSCALIHPSDPSCFSAYLSHTIQSSAALARFFTLFYSAMSLPRYQSFVKSPVQSLNRLAQTILRTTASISGAIGASWAGICLFSAILPHKMFPRFRFFLGGFLGGCFQLLDRTPAGRANSLYAARVSVDSLWKVGVKHGWWRGFRGGDVLVFVAGLALLNSVDELSEDAVQGKGVRMVLRVLSGDQEIGLPARKI